MCLLSLLIIRGYVALQVTPLMINLLRGQWLPVWGSPENMNILVTFCMTFVFDLEPLRSGQ